MQVDKVLLAFLAFASAVAARNLRCPPEIATNSVFSNRLSPSKYFRCSAMRLLEDFECSDGELFDPEMLICHKPVSGRCACPTTTACPCPTTTACPCPTTTPCQTTTSTTTTTTTTTTQCPTTTTQCPTTTTQCPCPPETTTTPCPCPPVTPCPQTIEQQQNLIEQQNNLQTILKPCENCVQGEVQTQIPGFPITPPPKVSYDKFGIADVPSGYIIITDPPPPPCY